MSSPSGSIRPLPYSLRNSADTDGELPSSPSVVLTSLDGWVTSDPDERVNIVMNLSLNEYVALATCIDVGRDIAYGDNSLYLWWIWVRGITTMSLCDAVAECIQNDLSVQNAVQDIARAGNPDSPPSGDNLSINLFDDGGLCDTDSIYGYCRALWNYIDANTIDVLEKLEEAANAGEQAARAISAMPIVGLAPVDEFIDWIGAIPSFGLAAYNASKTTAVEDQIVCDLMCIAQANGCNLTSQDVIEYFLFRIGGVDVPTVLATIAEWMIFMVSGTYLSDRIIYLWSCFQLQIVLAGSAFTGISFYDDYVKQARTGEPDSDWMLLCDPCGAAYMVDWLGNNGDPATDGFAYLSGVYVPSPPSGNRIDSTQISTFTTEAKIDYTFTGITVIKRMYMTTDINGVVGAFRGLTMRLYDASGNVIVNEGINVDGSGSHTLEWNGSQVTGINWRIEFRVAARYDSAANYARMTDIEVNGEGANPWI